MRSIEIELTGFEAGGDTFDLHLDFTFGVHYADRMSPPDPPEVVITEMWRSGEEKPLPQGFVDRFAEEHYDCILELAEEKALDLWEVAQEERYEEQWEQWPDQ